MKAINEYYPIIQSSDYIRQLYFMNVNCETIIFEVFRFKLRTFDFKLDSDETFYL